MYLFVCRVAPLICVKIFETFLYTYHTKAPGAGLLLSQAKGMRVIGTRNFLNISSLSDTFDKVCFII
jgi:hypothetical protein